MTDALDAELEDDLLIAAVQERADSLCARGYLSGALVLLASPRTVREQRLVARVGHLLPVREASVESGNFIVLPLDAAEDYVRDGEGPN